jgi:NADP-dependent 3-hydroxy acid dehydrogenase YdfG
LGRATAEELTERGHHVIATARNLSALDDLAVAKRLQLDVTDDDSVARAAKEAGRVDVLIMCSIVS